MTSCLLITDFVNDLLKKSLEDLNHTVVGAPYAQIFQVLSDENHECFSVKAQISIIWSKPESVILSFKNFLETGQVDINLLLKEVDEYVDLIKSVSDRLGQVVMFNWSLPDWVQGPAHQRSQPLKGVTDILQRLNMRLAERAQDILLVDADTVIRESGGYSSKLWYMAKIPYDQKVFTAAARNIHQLISPDFLQKRKLIVVDLDNTLWGGVIGDDGLSNIVLGGHHPNGEAFVDFQKELKSLSNRGYLLAIASKNSEEVALEAIRKHPEMILKEEDFISCKINWNDKAANICEILDEVNLGEESVVFIDDNPVERDRVRHVIKGALVPEWPKDPHFYCKALLEISEIRRNVSSDDDLKRSQYYATETKRKTSLKKMGSQKDWLMSLDLKAIFSPLDKINAPRIVQLMNKTNQFNLSTRRMNDSEFSKWANRDEVHALTCRVRDKFGDYGLIGFVTAEILDKKANIFDFVMSCRVLGRGIEETLMRQFLDDLSQKGVETVEAIYVPTDRNGPILEFLQSTNGIEEQDDYVYSFNLKDPLNPASHVLVEPL